MELKQIKFYDHENDALVGGFLLEDGSVVCGECGGIILADELEDHGIEILEIYNNWVSLSEEIMGN